MFNANGIKQVQKFLEEKIGIPGRDLYDLPTSLKRFPDGAQYRIYGQQMQSLEALEALIDKANELGVTINKFGNTRGIFLLIDDEIRSMAKLAKNHGMEMFMNPGPRAPYDISAQAATGTFEAGRIGYRLRGSDQVVHWILDVMRAIKLGVRGFHVCDEGIMYVVGKMRKEGLIPQDVQFKISAHAGHGNPASFKLLEELGADSINPVRDLSLPMIAALRAAIEVPLDVHVDNPKTSGGFVRFYEAPEMVRVGSPIYLKTGGSVYGTHAHATTPQEARKVAERCAIVKMFMEKFYPEAVQSKPCAEGSAIPK